MNIFTLHEYLTLIVASFAGDDRKKIRTLWKIIFISFRYKKHQARKNHRTYQMDNPYCTQMRIYSEILYLIN